MDRTAVQKHADTGVAQSTVPGSEKPSPLASLTFSHRAIPEESKVSKFSNGATLECCSRPTSDQTTLVWTVNVGSTHAGGRAHFLEHSIADDARILRDGTRLGEAIDRLDGKLGAWVDTTRTKFTLTVPHNRVTEAIMILREVVTDFVPDPSRMEGEKRVLCVEGFEKGSPVVQKVHYPTDWDRARVAGTREFILKTTPQDLSKIHHHYYQANRFHIAIDGTIDSQTEIACRALVESLPKNFAPALQGEPALLRVERAGETFVNGKSVSAWNRSLDPIKQVTSFAYRTLSRWLGEPVPEPIVNTVAVFSTTSMSDNERLALAVSGDALWKSLVATTRTRDQTTYTPHLRFDIEGVLVEVACERAMAHEQATTLCREVKCFAEREVTEAFLAKEKRRYLLELAGESAQAEKARKGLSFGEFLGVPPNELVDRVLALRFEDFRGAFKRLQGLPSVHILGDVGRMKPVDFAEI